MEYLKINSLWKREQFAEGRSKGSHGKLIVGDYSEPEFDSVKRWRVDEKVDGTNIRIIFERDIPSESAKVKIGGRTSNAQVPCLLLEYLQSHFTLDRMSKAFGQMNHVILFGEG